MAESETSSILQRHHEITRRMQARIDTQRDSIDRLLVDGSYDEEMAALVDRIADLRSENEALKERLGM